MINSIQTRSCKYNKKDTRQHGGVLCVQSSCLIKVLVVFAAFFLTACATTQPEKEIVQSPVSLEVLEQAQQEQALKAVQPTLKRKIAIGRFTNESRYGRGLLVDGDNDPLGKQVSDMLLSRLTQSGRFIVLERNDLGKLAREQSILAGGSGMERAQIDVSKAGAGDDDYSKEIALSNPMREELKLVGADALIVGSLTEFSRRVEGKSGFLSGTKLQVAEAKVDVRLVDPVTGVAFFSVSGSGKADVESGTVAGFGSKSNYDGSLNDKAIGAAISDMIDSLINKLEARPWKASVLQVQDGQVFLSGGERQGLELGDELIVYQETKSITSDRGFAIQLPPKKVGRVKVVSFFGDSETNEGSVATLIEGKVDQSAGIYVAEQ